MSTEKVFAKGLIFKLPHEKAPEFIKGSVAIKLEEFLEFASSHVNERGWVEFDLKVGQSGKPYAELNQWKPQERTREKDGYELTSGKKPAAKTEPGSSRDMDDEIPF